MNQYEKKLHEFINREYISSDICYDHNLNYNKKVKSIHKRKTNRDVERIVTYTSYEIYRKVKLPDGDRHINFISFIKLTFYIFQEIVNLILVKKIKWKITGLGSILNYTFLDNTVSPTNTLPEEYKKINNNLSARITSYINFNKNSSYYLRRFRFKFRYSIKSLFCKDYMTYNQVFTHKQINKIYTS